MVPRQCQVAAGTRRQAGGDGGAHAQDLQGEEGRGWWGSSLHAVRRGVEAGRCIQKHKVLLSRTPLPRTVSSASKKASPTAVGSSRSE